MSDYARRAFLKAAGFGTVSVPLLAAMPAEARRTVAAPKVPAIPTLSLRADSFGVKGDGIFNNTAALQQALDRCAVLGGGEVVVSAGRYSTGTIYIRSNTRLRFEAGAEIVGSNELSDYPIHQVRWEGNWVAGHDALIHAVDADNIAIVGPGKIFGSVAVGGRPTQDHPFRHPALIEFINCRNVLMDGFYTSSDRMWNIHPTYCENVVARNLTIRSTTTFSDGIDVDSCRHVRIENCDISVGDDCVAIKSGRGMEGYLINRPSEDIVITGCTFADSRHACVSIGSEVSAGARGVRVSNCKFTHAKSHAIFLKSRIGRGAFIEDFSADNLDVANCEKGFLCIDLLTIGYRDPHQVAGEAGIPRAAKIRISNVRVHAMPKLVDAVNIHPLKPLIGLSLRNISGTCENGLSLANIRRADLAGIALTGLRGPLCAIHNVTGNGLTGAVAIPGPELPDLEPEPEIPYLLK